MSGPPVAPRMRLRVLCAPNAFRGTLSAAAAARALAAGVRAAGGEPIGLPVADGGDGTLDVLVRSVPGARVERHRVSGPLGGRAVASLAWLDERTAVVELAGVAGLRRLATPRPLEATSRGVGEMVARALDGGARRVVVGLGGSASTDGGAGLLAALGARLVDRRGRPLRPGGGALVELDRVDLTEVDARVGGLRLEAAVDVQSPLLGPAGAASVFAPQKGASPGQVVRLEDGLRRLASLLERDGGLPAGLSGTPGTGAAGGCGFGLAVLGAALVPGAALVADIVGLDAALARCDLVITGEGRLDAQTAAGKAPAEVARRAGRHGVPCVAVAGSVVTVPPGFTSAVSLGDIALPGEDPLRVPARLLRRAAAALTRAATPGGNVGN